MGKGVQSTRGRSKSTVQPTGRNKCGCCFLVFPILVGVVAILFGMIFIGHNEKDNFLPICYNTDGSFYLCKIPPITTPSSFSISTKNWIEEKSIGAIHYVVESIFHYFGSKSISEEIKENIFTLSGKDGRIEIQRDEHGIPYVHSKSLFDATFAQGYICAQDRLYQMDIQRRVCSGRLSEYFGDKAKETDKLVRILGFAYSENFEGMAKNRTYDFPNKSKLDILPYVNVYLDGVNSYLASNVRSFIFFSSFFCQNFNFCTMLSNLLCLLNINL